MVTSFRHTAPPYHWSWLVVQCALSGVALSAYRRTFVLRNIATPLNIDGEGPPEPGPRALVSYAMLGRVVQETAPLRRLPES